MIKYFLAIDLGATSLRHVIGIYDTDMNTTTLEEVYRAKNIFKDNKTKMFWDLEYLFKEIKKGIAIALDKYKYIESMSIDSWGCDYVLMHGNKANEECYCYRDNRTFEFPYYVHKLISSKELYKITGIQKQEFNTIYQLYWDKINNRLNGVTDFLMIPEYFNYLLTGVKMKEYTNATTTSLVNVKTKEFDEKIISSLDLPRELFPKLHQPKEVVGYFTKDVQKEVGGNIKVVLCASHDTASAIEGLDTLGLEDNALYISSGTWSLLGFKTLNPIINDKARIANYTNEGGLGYFRFQKNIVGMWIFEQYLKSANVTLEEALEDCKNSRYEYLMKIDDRLFVKPDNMKKAIAKWFKYRKIPAPAWNGDYVKTIFHSLAYFYSEAVKEIEEITEHEYDTIYIVGGGAKNEYLNRQTEIYTKKKVIPVPIEASSKGNILIQVEVYNEQRNN